MLQNPNAIGAAPAQGNPQQSPKLPPQAIMALRKDPQLIQAVTKFFGRPIPLDGLPENVLMELAGAVHKLGVDGAVALMAKVIPPQIKAQILAKYGQAQGQPMPPQGRPVPPQGMPQ